MGIGIGIGIATSCIGYGIMKAMAWLAAFATVYVWLSAKPEIPHLLDDYAITVLSPFVSFRTS